MTKISRYLFISLFFIFIIGNVFAVNKPDYADSLKFFRACTTGDTKAAEDFLKQYPDCADIELTFDFEKISSIALEIADSSESFYQQIVSHLVIKIVNQVFENNPEAIEILKNYKSYPIIVASQYGSTDIVKLLMSYHSNLELKDNYGNTALIQASYNGHLEVVKELLENKAEINTKNIIGSTALMFASYNNQLEVVKGLLETKADTSARMNDGWTALILASEQGHVEIVQELFRCIIVSSVSLADWAKSFGKKSKSFLPKISSGVFAPS